MKLFVTLAWRNIWRNKRRTIISALSIFFSVFLALITRSMQNGTYDYMIDSAVRMYTGYLQIHSKGYWEERSLEKSFVYDKNIFNNIESIENVEIAVPRLENFLLVSSKEVTKVANVICIDPARENLMTKLKEKLVKGEYLNEYDEGILISEGLARMLNINVGDSVVLYGQGIYGMTASALSPVVGIIKFNLPDMNNSIIYLPLRYGQNLFSMENKVTSASIMLNNPKKLNNVYKNIKSQLTDDYEVMKWDELMPELVQGIEIDSISGMFMLFILYLIIAFGIFGTIMMMTVERTKEFGILISIGMKKSILILITILETIFISFIGAFTGLLIAVPVIFYLNKNPIQFGGELAEMSLKFGVEPILPFSTDAGIFLAQTLVVLIIAFFSALYPLTYIKKLQPVKAIRQ
ncbi:FtsX-like permease family protein [Ignavibacteria bacterium 4148-Me]|uniref:ABC transporter permease n=1 Tax=Rosettibacter primus TaxID=3111523 RepID=UPI00336BD217